MSKYNIKLASGFWNDNKQAFSNKLITEDTWDGIEDAEDEEIFYYLDGVEALGDHGDFTITKVEEL